MMDHKIVNNEDCDMAAPPQPIEQEFCLFKAYSSSNGNFLKQTKNKVEEESQAKMNKVVQLLMKIENQRNHELSELNKDGVMLRTNTFQQQPLFSPNVILESQLSTAVNSPNT